MSKKLTHQQKVKLARRLMSKAEIKRHVPIFGSDNWGDRVWGKKQKQERQLEKNG
jgi:hypothetical protein